MDWSTEEIKNRNSTAESLARFSIGLWTVSLIEYLSSGTDWATIALIVLGVLSVLTAGYFFLPLNWRQKAFLAYLNTSGTMRIIRPLLWLLVLAPFGVNLVKTENSWLIIIGVITVAFAFSIFYISLFTMRRHRP